VRVIVPRSHDGAISCRADRWTRQSGGGLGRIFSFFGGTPLGNPGLDVARGVQSVRERLRRRGLEGEREPPIEGVIVFTNPAAKLRIDGCSETVTGLKQLRNHVRGVKGPLNQQAIAKVIQALEA
jgi:hypothetical protein